MIEAVKNISMSTVSEHFKLQLIGTCNGTSLIMISVRLSFHISVAMKLQPTKSKKVFGAVGTAPSKNNE